MEETVQHTKVGEPYVSGVAGVQIPRSSLKMAGICWLKAPRTPVFKVGIHRAQRFVHGAWFTPLEACYSRAIPLRFLRAFPPKAKPMVKDIVHASEDNNLLLLTCGTYDNVVR